MSTTELIRARTGRIEAATAVALYGVYELVRGFGGEDWTAARLHTADIVGVERSLGIFWERGIQAASTSVPGLASVLGVLYISLHFVVTIAFLVWVHRRRPDAFATVRTTLVVATGLALAGYLHSRPLRRGSPASASPTPSRRREGEPQLRSPRRAVQPDRRRAEPPLRLRAARRCRARDLATRRWVRIAGALYPFAMLYIIVATGDHFFVDAALGGAVVVAAWLVARALVPGDPPVAPAERTPAYA